MAATDTLVDFIQPQLTGAESDDEIRLTIRTAWDATNPGTPLDDNEVEDLLKRLKPPPLSMLVDWGQELPRIGHIARPQFILLCPAGYSERPNVIVKVDNDLDSQDDPQRELRSDSPGLYEFFVPFRLTTDGIDCRPGQYLLELDIRFPPLGNRRLPRFFRYEIRLHVPRDDGSGERELVIDGDGDSVVNLHGHDLKSYSRVVLKGGEKALINLQKGASLDNLQDDETEGDPLSITRAYPLKVRQEQIPYRSQTLSRGQSLESAMLTRDSQKRWLLIPKRRARWKWLLGRQRQVNDVITRFLPPSEDNDLKTRKLSRKHLELELTGDGLHFTDRSSSGVTLDDRPVDDGTILDKDDAGPAHLLELGDPLGDSLCMDLFLFAQPEDQFERSHQDIQNMLCYEALDESPRQLKHSHESRIDTVLLRRTDELADQEEYILLCRHLSIGSSTTYSSVVIDDDEDVQRDHAWILYAGRQFWLQNRTTDPTLVRIDDEPLPPLELAALKCEMKLTFGSTTLEFDRSGQLYL